MSKAITYDKFEYFLEDLDCQWCLYSSSNRKTRRKGCNSVICRYEDEKQDAMAHGRVRRLQPISCLG